MAQLSESPVPGASARHVHKFDVEVPPLGLGGTLRVPDAARGVIVFAHGSGSSRFSPRNIEVAHRLNDAGFATLLLDLLTAPESGDRRRIFDIPLLAERLQQAVRFVDGGGQAPVTGASTWSLASLPLGFFGASTGAGAALAAAADLGDRVGAIVSRGGRPDLAAEALGRVHSPTLLIVGGADTEVERLNRDALERLAGERAISIVPHATHLFEERGALEQVTELATAWFETHLGPAPE